MQSLPVLILRLVTLKVGPEAFPARKEALWLLVCLYLGLNVAINAWVDRWREGLGSASLGLVFTAVALWLLLRWRGFEARFVQTFTASLGATLFFTLALAPISIQAMEMLQQNVQPSMLTGLVSLLFLGWSFSVDAHILRKALEIGRTASLLLVALLYLSLSIVSTVLFGPVA